MNFTRVGNPSFRYVKVRATIKPMANRRKLYVIKPNITTSKFSAGPAEYQPQLPPAKEVIVGMNTNTVNSKDYKKSIFDVKQGFNMKGVMYNAFTGALLTYDAYQDLARRNPELANKFQFIAQSAFKNIIKGAGNMGNRRGKGGSNSGGRGRGSNGSGGGSSNNSSNSSSGGTSYGMSNNPQPQSIELRSGIVPNLYVSDYMDPVENICSPLHLSSSLFRIPDTSANKLYKYFTDLIAFDIQTKAQANVGFNLNVTFDFSASNLLTAFNSLIYALQIYYYYASIITYHSNPSNKNAGMIYIRSKITPDEMESLSKLSRRLRDTPCPPNVMNLIRFLAGNFLSGDNPGSTMIKIVPAMVTEDGVYGDNEIEAALAGLSTTANSAVFSLLRRAVPQWIPSTLPDVPDVPVVSRQFETIFANLPFVTTSATGLKSPWPFVVSLDQTIQYNSYANDLDGLAFALTSVYYLTDYQPSLMVPPNMIGYESGLDTRLSFADIGGVTKFWGSRSSAFLVRSRNETYINNGTSGTALGANAHLPGANNCKGVSSNTIEETSMLALDYLMSLNTISRSSVTKQIRGN